MALPAIIGSILVPVLVEGVKAALDRGLSPKQAAQEAADRAISDPAIQNQMNAEKPYQSRVVVGSSGALLPAIGYLIWAFSSHGFDLAAYDPSSTFMAVMTVAGAGYALFGRLRSGLKPLFSRG